MGMFDYIRCEYPLPDEGANELEYQTKDTPDQFMEHYLITSDGRLLKTTESVAYTEKEYEKLEPSAWGVRPWFRRVKIEEEVPYHGYIEFYSSNIMASGPRGVVTANKAEPTWWEYRAKFTDGKLVELTGGKSADSDLGPVITLQEFWREEKTD